MRQHAWVRRDGTRVTDRTRWRCLNCPADLDLGWDPELGYRAVYMLPDQPPTLDRVPCAPHAGWDANGSEVTDA